MSAKELDELLDRMPQIAEAVQKFTSESIQAQVFSALINAYGIATESPAHVTAARTLESLTQSSEDGSGTGLPAATKKTRSKTAPGQKVKQSFSFDKTLDLAKGGTPPFKEF